MHHTEPNDELELLADYYGLNFRDLKVEWELLQNAMIFEDLETIESITEYAQNHFSEFPLLSPLLQTYLILPTSTSDVERGFSTMNRIKTNDRNRLSKVLVHCMLISMYGKEFD